MTTLEKPFEYASLLAILLEFITQRLPFTRVFANLE